jgi:5-methyltetrahydropteroyltriglutamate--homocysteine methyltransferase
MASYRADHVGSFLRPPELLDARTAHAEGRIADAELRAAEDRAILTILEFQRQAGLDVYSDGEYRRGMWITGLPAAVDGFGPGPMLNIQNWRGRPLPYVPGQTGTRHAATAGQNPAAVISGKLTAKRRITEVESTFLRQHAGGPYKITIPSPTWYLRGYNEAGKYVPVANLALSPQCGFASVAAGNEISWDDQRRKLDLLVDTARKVWGE